jgi:galactokinase
MADVRQVVHAFNRRFKRDPDVIVSAPGRINIIGEHIDYNDGYVLPLAIDRRVFAAAKKRTDKKMIGYSVNFQAEANLNPRHPTGEWGDYVRGVIDRYRKKKFKVTAFEAAFAGDVPVGAGLSSSAAIEVCAAYMFKKLFRYGNKPKDLALLAQEAEVKYVGVNCGIMDQFISALAQKDKALLIDCQTLRTQAIPFELPDYEIVLCNSMVKRRLASSEYNLRREECDKALKAIKKKTRGVKSWRDVKPDMINDQKILKDPIHQHRAKHILSETNRVGAAVRALKASDAEKLGELMLQSHASLRDDYEVSCPELNVLVEIAQDAEGFVGGRMMGGGFGGCTINLVQSEEVSGFKRRIRRLYEKKTGLKPDIFVFHSDDGMRLEKVET